MNQSKDLKKLSRADLLELLVEMGRENDRLRMELEEAKDALAERDLKLHRSGSLAEAALALNGVFEAADAACAQYIESMRAAYGIEAPIQADILDFDREATQAAVAFEEIAPSDVCAAEPSPSFWNNPETAMQVADTLAAAEARARIIVAEDEEKARKEIKRARKRARKITEKARGEATLILDEAEAILDEAKKKRKK